ncbi:5-methylcytosine restriction system specificity protein McrC [Prevotella sp.]|uniref:5-methylcytosine restriction system specificity protein McrC n=1 Tax=Prevotella sp. TaxID=59823 RepID=UPI00307AD86E
MITIQDNDYKGKVCSRHDAADLLPIANMPIRQLCDENEHLLVFPLSIDDTDDRIGDSTIVDIYAEDENSIRIKSGNIMGFVGRKNQQMKIYSRFDNQKHDFFLHYMLQKVFSFNIFNLDFTSSEDNVFEFLVYMFPAMLKKAMRQGIYKEYRRFRHNDANVRGTIDISRHIRENIPFRGTVAYNTREFSFDNSVTELIRHTIEYIKTIPSGDIILSSDKVVDDCIKKIVSYTPSYNHTERMKIIQDNLLPRNHPFYTEYAALQKLCIQILRHEEIKYGTDDEKIYGILFDGAWLWEEYLNTLLCEKGFIHPENKLGTGAIYLFEHGGQRFPDFWKQDIVLDAKYKKLAINGNRLDIERDDVHQIMAYMYRLKAPKGGIICPFMGDDNKVISQNMHKDSYLGSMYLYALAIPRDCISYEEFVKRIAEKENALLKETS